MKNRGFSRFSKISWKIWVSISTTPPSYVQASTGATGRLKKISPHTSSRDGRKDSEERQEVAPPYPRCRRRSPGRPAVEKLGATMAEVGPAVRRHRGRGDRRAAGPRSGSPRRSVVAAQSHNRVGSLECLSCHLRLVQVVRSVFKGVLESSTP